MRRKLRAGQRKSLCGVTMCSKAQKWWTHIGGGLLKESSCKYCTQGFLKIRAWVLYAVFCSSPRQHRYEVQMCLSALRNYGRWNEVETYTLRCTSPRWICLLIFRHHSNVVDINDRDLLTPCCWKHRFAQPGWNKPMVTWRSTQPLSRSTIVKTKNELTNAHENKFDDG